MVCPIHRSASGLRKIGSTEELHRLLSNCAALGKNRPRECPAAAIFFQVQPVWGLLASKKGPDTCTMMGLKSHKIEGSKGRR